jgi:hypothetical protein
MKIVLYTDNTLPLAVESGCVILNSIFKSVSFSAGKERFRINNQQINAPVTFEKLPKKLLKEANGYDCAIMCTNVPYDNNFFFESEGKLIIISFYGWNLYTDLPITNGLFYFIASIIAEEIHLGTFHEINKGCLNDFWWDKTGINFGMRAAFICDKCKEEYSGDKNILGEIEKMLDIISSASRTGIDVMTINDKKIKKNKKESAVFLCHNSEDKPLIRKINELLEAEGISTWFDEEKEKPGELWQDKLENEINTISKACVFVGQNGIGPWHHHEIRAIINEFIQKGCRVIPVILQDATTVPKLPIFLKAFTWVDLRTDFDKNIKRLVNALKQD